MHQGVFHHEDSGVLIRCGKLEYIGRVIGGGHTVCYFLVCTFAQLQRIRHTVNRMNGQMQVIIGLTVVMRRVHGRIVAYRVINTGGR